MRECLGERLSEEVLAEMAVQAETILEKHKIRDWPNNPDVLNEMRNAIEDYLFDEIEPTQNIRFSNVELDEIIEQGIDIARKRV